MKEPFKPAELSRGGMIGWSECSPENAIQVLELAAYCMENEKPLPKSIGDFIALAFRRVAAVDDHEKRPAELAAYLNLTSPNRRIKVPESDLASWVFFNLLENSTWSQTAIIKLAATHFDIAESTATDKWIAWSKRYPEAVTKLKKSHGLPPLPSE
jgi:hypothetical protein